MMRFVVLRRAVSTTCLPALYANVPIALFVVSHLRFACFYKFRDNDNTSKHDIVNFLESLIRAYLDFCRSVERMCCNYNNENKQNCVIFCHSTATLFEELQSLVDHTPLLNFKFSMDQSIASV